MFLSLEDTLINLDSVARLDYIDPLIDTAYIQITYKTGIVENISGNDIWNEFQFIRSELLRTDKIIPIEGEIEHDGN